eukprot:5776787-Heterocapsa_arctica.AAC.1
MPSQGQPKRSRWSTGLKTSSPLAKPSKALSFSMAPASSRLAPRSWPEPPGPLPRSMTAAI